MQKVFKLLKNNGQAFEIQFNLYTCGVASSDFTRKVYFENHIKSHEAGKAYLCDSCGKGFSTLMELRRYTGKYHKTEVSCIQCAKSFTSVDQLNQHMKSHMLDPYCCDVCSKTFTRLDNLKRHKAEGCLQSDESFNCDHCEKVFSSDLYLKKHMKVIMEVDFLSHVSCIQKLLFWFINC